jgi:hypothetical protein
MLGKRGNWDITWEIALKIKNLFPIGSTTLSGLNTREHFGSLGRKAGFISTVKAQKNRGWLTTLGNLVSMLWRNQWIQEGEEVMDTATLA